MTTKSPSEIEEELKKLIQEWFKIGETGSKMSKAKARSKATALSDFLGWTRK